MAEGAEASSHPNVVFILADDLGYGDLGSYGHPYAKTPNLDRLAEEGTRFAQFYVAGPKCIPSRAAFMTGIFPARFAKYPGDFGLGDRPTITALFAKAGYRTGHFGKWHMGPDPVPNAYGIETRELSGPSRLRDERKNRSRDAKAIDGAIRFIEKNAHQPFYLQIWGVIPHFPIAPSDEFLAPFKDVKVSPSDFPPYMQEKLARVASLGGDVDASMRAYLAEVYSLDLDVGRLLDKIDQIGLRENTIVVFTSDNGAARVLSAVPETTRREQLRLKMLGSPGVLRGDKGSLLEGGVRSPFIVRWPGKIPAGRVDKNSVTAAVDWFPTLCAIARLQCEFEGLDGEDVSEIWQGTPRERKRPLYWKDNWANAPIAVRHGPWKLHQAGSGDERVELYDVTKDPAERNNLASRHPDVVAQLQAWIVEWNASLPKHYWRREGVNPIPTLQDPVR